MLGLFLILILNVIGLQNSIEDGWRDIKPLKTSKITVERLLGNPVIDDNNYYRYKSSDVFVVMNYTTAPCEVDNYKRGKYKVLKNMVLNYNVRFPKGVRLTSIEFRREKYKRTNDYHLLNVAYYENQRDGVTIEVGIENDVEYVRDISFRPSKKDIEKYKCNK